MSKFAAIDAAILAAIKAGITGFHAINRVVVNEALALATPDRHGDKNEWRVTDRRLQALRKRGAIRHSGKNGWTLGGAQS